MTLKKSYLLLIIIITFSTELYSQTNFIKLSLGGIRNFTFLSKQTNCLSLYPELDFGGKFFVKGLKWELGIGFWDDGIDSPLLNENYSTFNYSSFIVVYRLKLVPKEIDEEFYIPMKLIAGISYHNVNAKRVWGEGPHILVSEDHEEELFYYEAGLELYFPVNKKADLPYDFRYSLSVGVEYGL